MSLTCRGIFVFLNICFIALGSSATEHKVVHIYCWMGAFAPSVIEKFKKETGITVRLSYYDSEEILEAKLLSVSKMYDVVMPSAVPYFQRQKRLGLYRKIDRSQLVYWHNLEPRVLKMLGAVDPNNTFAVPHNWGTTGFAYNCDQVEKLLPAHTKLDTYAVLMNPRFAEKLAPFGIGLLDQAQDLFIAVGDYLGAPLNLNPKAIESVQNALARTRPYFKFFTSNPDKMISSLLSGDACLVQIWSGEALRAQALGKMKKKRIAFVIPKENAGVWCDLMAIPKNAPHPKNAHLFINFMLRPDNAAENMVATLTTIPNIHARKILPPHLRNNPVLFPSHEDLNHLVLNSVLPLADEKKINRAWAYLKLAA